MSAYRDLIDALLLHAPPATAQDDATFRGAGQCCSLSSSNDRSSRRADRAAAAETTRRLLEARPVGGVDADSVRDRGPRSRQSARSFSS